MGQNGTGWDVKGWVGMGRDGPGRAEMGWDRLGQLDGAGHMHNTARYDGVRTEGDRMG